MNESGEHIDPLERVLEDWFEASERGETPHLSSLCGGDARLLARARRAIAREKSALHWLLEAPPSPSPTTAGAASERRAEIGGYRLLETLGRGGMATVFLAEDRQLSRLIALKVFDDHSFTGPEARERFRREATITAALEHSGVVPVYAVGEADGALYIAMKLLSGPPLDQILEPLSPREAASVGIQVAEALAEAHDLGIIHRDVKPANILLDDGRPVVVDFGLARMESEVALTRSGTIPGTIAYIAPEVLSGAVHSADARSDVYSLGATLYEIASGRRCFDGGDVDTIVQRAMQNDPPPLVIASADRDFAVIVGKCLRKSRDDRYASMREVASELRLYVDGQPILARPRSVTDRLVERLRRNRFATLAIGVLVLLLATLAGAFLTREIQSSSRRERLVRTVDEAALRFDIPTVESAVRSLESHGEVAETARLRLRLDGLIALDDLLDQVQFNPEAHDPDLLRESLRRIEIGETAIYQPRLVGLASAFVAFLLDDLVEARARITRLENEHGHDRATGALRVLLDSEGAETPRISDTPEFAASNTLDHVLAFSALRLAGSPLETLREEVAAARTLDPTDHRVQVSCAILLDLDDEFAAARAAFHALERPGRSNSAMIRNAALQSLRLGEVDAALADLDRIPIELRSPLDEKNRLVVLYEGGRFEQFDAGLEAALERWPRSSELLMVRATREYARRDWMAAIATCATVLESATYFLHRDRARAESWLARWQSTNARKPADDVSNVEFAAIAAEIERDWNGFRDPHSRSIAYMIHARIAITRNDPERAMESFRGSIAAEPANAVPHLHYAQFLYQRMNDAIKARAASTNDSGSSDAADPRIAEFSAEARRQSQAILAMHSRQRIPFPPKVLSDAAYLECVLAMRDEDRPGCGVAARIGSDAAERAGIQSRAPYNSFGAFLEWAGK